MGATVNLRLGYPPLWVLQFISVWVTHRYGCYSSSPVGLPTAMSATVHLRLGYPPLWVLQFISGWVTHRYGCYSSSPVGLLTAMGAIVHLRLGYPLLWVLQFISGWVTHHHGCYTSWQLHEEHDPAAAALVYSCIIMRRNCKLMWCNSNLLSVLWVLVLTVLTN